MTTITEFAIVHAVDESVVETVEAFVRFRPGFHGDTGIRDYLYHRLMTNLPCRGIYRREDGGGTLLAQAEWYTALKYRRTGKGASAGRFDLGIPYPEDLDLPRPRPLATFECGRNKRVADLLRGFDAPPEHEGPEPADITKLAREISHKSLPYGYALEFYDDRYRGEAEHLMHKLCALELRTRSARATSRGLHIVVLECVEGSRPILKFLPEEWEERIRLQFPSEMDRISGLICASNLSTAPRSIGSFGGSPSFICDPTKPPSSGSPETGSSRLPAEPLVLVRTSLPVI